MKRTRDDLFNVCAHMRKRSRIAGVLCFCLIAVSFPAELMAQEKSVCQPSVFSTKTGNSSTALDGEISGDREECEENDLLEKTGVMLPETAGKEKAVEDGPADPAFGTIRKDTLWKAGRLTGNGKLTVEKGVTLTLGGLVEIEGNVVIEGEGIIKRGYEDAGFELTGTSTCQMKKITLDGGSLRSKAYLIRLNEKGKLILDDGCILQNVGDIKSPGTVFANGAEVHMRNAAIRNCRAEGDGSAIYAANNSKVCISSGAVIRDCSGSTVYVRGSQVSVSGNAAIQDCTGTVILADDSAVNVSGITIQDFQGGLISADDSVINISGVMMKNFSGNLIIVSDSVVSIHHVTLQDCQEGFANAISVSNSKVDINEVMIQNCRRDTGSAIAALESEVSVKNTTVQDCQTYMGGMLYAKNSNVSLKNVAVQNCQAEYGGAVYALESEISISNNTTIQGCQANNGGAICAEFSDVNIDSVMIDKCYALWHGGAIEAYCSKLSTQNTVIQNCQASMGGAIEALTAELIIHNTTIQDCQGECGGAIRILEKTTADIKATTFRNNICTDEKNKGSGAIYHFYEDSELFLSGNVYFSGNDDLNSGMDGVMLDNDSKFKIREALTDPVMIYARASEGRVIAEGADGYIVEVDPDVKKIVFSDTGSSGEIWYPVLDEANNRILLSRTNPGYGFSVFYRSNGAQGQVTDSKIYGQGDTVTVQTADGLTLADHRFAGWNTKPDGSGKTYKPGDKIENIDRNITLYAVFVQAEADYRTEYYLQDIEGDGYTLADADTKVQRGPAGSTVKAEAKAYRGFTENTAHPLRNESGIITDGSVLVLKLYYDRISYTAEFCLNGGEGVLPDAQEIRYGGCLKKADNPVRRGYSFRGWYKDADGSEGQAWDFDKPVEQNADEPSVTLYAKWVDDTAPVLGETSYNAGYADLKGWIIRDRNLILTIPVTEEGSGIKKAEYILIPETGESGKGEAEIIRTAGESRASGRGAGQAARITINENFKGAISLKVSDNAGNESAGRTLTSEGGGVIVEDCAPEIDFSAGKSENGNVSVRVTVRDDVNRTGEGQITGGLSRVSWRSDGGEEKEVQGKDFSESIVPFCDFDVDIEGEGEHTLHVTAVDHAGNENRQEFQAVIAKDEADSPGGRKPSKPSGADASGSANPAGPSSGSVQDGNFSVSLPPGSQPVMPEREPDTRDRSVSTEAYAMTAATAGLLYLYLYFDERKKKMIS